MSKAQLFSCLRSCMLACSWRWKSARHNTLAHLFDTFDSILRIQRISPFVEWRSHTIDRITSAWLLGRLHALINIACSFLRGALLCKTIGLSHPLAAHAYLDGERLRMFRPTLANNDV